MNVKEEIKEIPINIWDDYHEDGYLPEGESQETYAYVEDSDISHDKQGESLFLLMRLINEKYDLQGVEMSLTFYDSAKKYPQLVGTEFAYSLYKRYELRFKNLTHKQREFLVKNLNEQEILFNKELVRIYSES